MRRRNLLFGLLAVATLRGERGQQNGKVYRIAYARPSGDPIYFTDSAGTPSGRAMLKELRRLGYIEGQNLLIERFSGEGRAAHYPDLARDVVRSF
jgi:putative ABC transport system substrate-binding protein